MRVRERGARERDDVCVMRSRPVQRDGWPGNVRAMWGRGRVERIADELRPVWCRLCERSVGRIMCAMR